MDVVPEEIVAPEAVQVASSSKAGLSSYEVLAGASQGP
jgi:hypothetical protein